MFDHRFEQGDSIAYNEEPPVGVQGEQGVDRHPSDRLHSAAAPAHNWRRVISVQAIVCSLESSEIRRNHNQLKSLNFFFGQALTEYP